MKKTREETEDTVMHLMDVARKKFTESGYQNTSLEDISQEAGVTRGALYHHFKNKKGLFLAVFEEMQKSVGERVEEAALKSDDEWAQLLNGCRAFLEAALESERQRIMLIEGPSVLGWETFREMDEKYSMSSLNEQLNMMQRKDLLRPVSTEALTYCLSGAMNEAVLWIAEGGERANVVDDAMDILFLMFEGVRKPKE